MSVVITALSEALDAGTFRARFTALDPASEAYGELFFSADESSPKELWLATSGGVTVGRIVAACSPTRPGTGYVGLFAERAPPALFASVAARLLETASTWLARRGIRTIFGPVDVNTWFRYRLAADRSAPTNPSFGWEPQTPEAHTAAFAASGFAPAMRFHSEGFETPTFAPALRLLGPCHQAALRRGFTFRPFGARGPGIERDLGILHALSMEGFKDSYLFEPIAEPLFRRLYAGLVLRADYSPSHFLVDPDGVEQGFLFGFVDQGYAVVKTVCVLPAVPLRSGGKWAASNALLYLALQVAAERRLKGGISALVREDNGSTRLERRQRWAHAWRNEYVLMRKDV
jgi:hypothetical protein